MSRQSHRTTGPAPARPQTIDAKPEPRTAFGGTPAAPGHRPPDDAIRLRAYHNWEKAGRPPGDGVKFLLQAEQELRAR